jgi:hypothetical protein
MGRPSRVGARPIVSIRLGPRARIAAVVLVLGGAAWAAWALAGPGIADHLWQTGALESALAWDPADPSRHVRLAELYLGRFDGGSAGVVRGHLDVALHARPTHGWTWLQLAQLADREGDQAASRRALDTALRVDPHGVGLQWEAALLALRQGDRDRALEHLAYVLAVDPGQRDAAFQLARTLLGPGDSVVSLLPREPQPLAGMLAAAIRNKDLLLAEAIWERQAGLVPPPPALLQRQYLELLLGEGQGPAARSVWLSLVPDRQSTGAGDSVWNGGFESPRLLGWGFDWRVDRVWGVEVGLDRFVAAEGRQSLRLAFNSFPTLDYAGVWQPVAVEPGRSYRLRALVKALDFTTRSGLTLQVVSLDRQPRVFGETAAVSGTTGEWVPLEAAVRIPPAVSLVRLRLRREKAPGPEGNLGGKVWVDGVSLLPLDSRAAAPARSGAPSG